DAACTRVTGRSEHIEKCVWQQPMARRATSATESEQDCARAWGSIRGDGYRQLDLAGLWRAKHPCHRTKSRQRNLRCPIEIRSEKGSEYDRPGRATVILDSSNVRPWRPHAPLQRSAHIIPAGYPKSPVRDTGFEALLIDLGTRSTMWQTGKHWP